MSGAYLLSLMTAAVNGPYQLAAFALLPLLAAFLADAQRRRAGRALFNQPPQSRIANTTIMVIAVINGRGNPVISSVALASRLIAGGTK